MSTPQEIAEAASQPGTFNFLDRLRGRNYPAEVIEVYLDEAKGYALKKLEAKASGTVNDAALKKIEKEIEDLRAELRADAYFIHLRAVPSEAYDKLVDEANETFPPVYTEVSSPLTGQVTKTQEPSEERAALFTALKWVAFVEKVVDSSGAEATLSTADEAALWRLNLPIEAVLKVDMTLNELRMAVEWMDAIQDESFLATP
jgi:hypothetical protein